MMHLERATDRAPRAANLQAADVLAGTHAFGAILGALWRRARTGEGARLDVSMLECLVAADDATYGSVLNGGEEYGRAAAGHDRARDRRAVRGAPDGGRARTSGRGSPAPWGGRS